jgi:purine-binding chemotaxis protein CheW
VDDNKAAAGRFDPELVAGVVRGDEGEGSTTILDPERLLRGQFSRLGISRGGTTTAVSTIGVSGPAPVEPQRQVSLVSFELSNQEYALPLGRVQEIIPTPEHVSEVAGLETAVLGVVTLRNRLLPLVSLRALLGLPAQSDVDGRSKVVVLSIGKTSVGIVADRTRDILRIDPALMDAAPALLTRGEGDAEIESICRLDDGRRIVAVLCPDRLFRSDLVRRVLNEATADDPDTDGETMESAMADEQFIIFRLGDQDYGMPIAAVDEVARPPDRITRLPRAPAFVDGVMNLRGSVVPIVDLRRRFELGAAEPGAARRILILTVGGGQTGFMVDAVSEVLRVPADAIRQAPELSAEQTRLIGRVANLDLEGRMILLVDPAQLLDQIEADMLAKFERTGSPKELKVS